MNQKVYSVTEYTRREDYEVEKESLFGVFSSIDKAYGAIQVMRQAAEKRGDGMTPDMRGNVTRFENYYETDRVIPATGSPIKWIEWELNAATARSWDESYVYKISEAVLDEFVAE